VSDSPPLICSLSYKSIEWSAPEEVVVLYVCDRTRCNPFFPVAEACSNFPFARLYPTQDRLRHICPSKNFPSQTALQSFPSSDEFSLKSGVLFYSDAFSMNLVLRRSLFTSSCHSHSRSHKTRSNLYCPWSSRVLIPAYRPPSLSPYEMAN